MPYNHRSKNKKKQALISGPTPEIVVLDDGIERLQFNPADSRELALAVIRFVRRDNPNKANRYRRILTKLGTNRVSGEIYNDIIEPLLEFLDTECNGGIVKTEYPHSLPNS